MMTRVPNVNTIRTGWARGHPLPLTTDPEERYDEFNRWLEQERAQAKAEALREVAGELERAYEDDVLEARPEYVQWLHVRANEIERMES